MIQVSPGSCEAAHIIPHSKGNKYITKLHPRHHINLQPPLNDINDVRNGILIYIAFHHHLGLSEIAFLRTPNFAMATSDVPAVSSDPGLTARESRITMQYFTAHWKAVELRAAPHNSDARLSLQSQDFPTTLLLDYVYGCAALKKWANHDFYESLKTLARDDFYSNETSEDGIARDDLSSNGSADDENGRGKFRSHISSNNQKQVKQRKHAPRNKVNKARRGDSPTIQDVVMTLWLLNAKKARSQKDAENPDLNGIREKVEHWRQAVE
ncbi:hypothetical protein AGABI1DRAFT_132696 [Agaricus bisporus var. burnettii JB137-S8]|uniref:HNH nuclease domain-containing protein n=1 Tax=Agaricus bisporus var. burnettii (strain JB137-S8 / ATCC MYA-4627 / FGSC 10392) TaxID=597362 RepID=K5XKF9_AGABU|nr:uncharacterized protein AGABI1DRAFT_132696 [Agaricus bisporus var. burnettii JB137-S8]EKM74995.1 hypothetical protein AGABI1DRAFT_132696 [Agaricus bisporus var. burnettii JB137-S8]